MRPCSLRHPNHSITPPAKLRGNLQPHLPINLFLTHDLDTSHWGRATPQQPHQLKSSFSTTPLQWPPPLCSASRRDPSARQEASSELRRTLLAQSALRLPRLRLPITSAPRPSFAVVMRRRLTRSFLPGTHSHSSCDGRQLRKENWCCMFGCQIRHHAIPLDAGRRQWTHPSILYQLHSLINV